MPQHLLRRSPFRSLVVDSAPYSPGDGQFDKRFWSGVPPRTGVPCAGGGNWDSMSPMELEWCFFSGAPASQKSRPNRLAVLPLSRFAARRVARLINSGKLVKLPRASASRTASTSRRGGRGLPGRSAKPAPRDPWRRNAEAAAEPSLSVSMSFSESLNLWSEYVGESSDASSGEISLRRAGPLPPIPSFAASAAPATPPSHSFSSGDGFRLTVGFSTDRMVIMEGFVLRPRLACRTMAGVTSPLLSS